MIKTPVTWHEYDDFPGNGEIKDSEGLSIASEVRQSYSGNMVSSINEAAKLREENEKLKTENANLSKFVDRTFRALMDSAERASKARTQTTEA